MVSPGAAGRVGVCVCVCVCLLWQVVTGVYVTDDSNNTKLISLFSISWHWGGHRSSGVGPLTDGDSLQAVDGDARSY